MRLVPEVLLVMDMTWRAAISGYYARNSSAMQWGIAITQLLLVPTMALNLVGVVTITDPVRTWIVFPLALIETMNVTILLLSGGLGHQASARTCNWCGGRLRPEISAWVCTNCKHIDRQDARVGPAP